MADLRSARGTRLDLAILCDLNSVWSIKGIVNRYGPDRERVVKAAVERLLKAGYVRQLDYASGSYVRTELGHKVAFKLKRPTADCEVRTGT